MDIVEKVKDHIYKHHIPNKYLAKLINKSNAAITQWLDKQYQLGFDSVLYIVRKLWPDDEINIMGEYVLLQENLNARMALEYCSLNLLPQKNEVLSILDESINKEDNEWYKIYSLSNKRNTISQEQWLEELREVNPSYIELKVFVMIQKMNAYYDQRKMHFIEEISERALLLAQKIKSDFIRECYLLRIYQLRNIVKLYYDEIELARKYARKVLDIEGSRFITAAGYQALGESYLFEDYQKANEYLEIAHSKFTEINPDHKWALRSLNFLNFVWGKKVKHLLYDSDNPNDIHAIAYSYLQQGEKEKAKEQLGRINYEQLNNQLKAYHLYYQYLIHLDVNLLYKSITHFKKAGDKFYRRVAIRELYKLELEESLIESLSI